MAGNGYLQRRVSGAVKPEKQYEEKTFKILKDLTEVTAYLKSL